MITHISQERQSLDVQTFWAMMGAISLLAPTPLRYASLFLNSSPEHTYQSCNIYRMEEDGAVYQTSHMHADIFWPPSLQSSSKWFLHHCDLSPQGCDLE